MSIPEILDISVLEGSGWVGSAVGGQSPLCTSIQLRVDALSQQSLAMPSGQLMGLLNPIHLPPKTLSAWVQAASLTAGATKSPRP